MVSAKHAYTFAAIAAATLIACKKDKIEVKAETPGDYNHAGLQAAVDKFVAAGRSPEAYLELSQTISALRPGMDKQVAEEAELKLVTLALGPISMVASQDSEAHVKHLALTVWPALLAPKIEADTVVLKRDADAADLSPKPGESAAQYLERLCGGKLAGDCKHVVPESQGEIVEALAIRRATDRVRNAVSACLTCSTDPGWHTAVIQWEALDRAAVASMTEIRKQADPENWLVAGSAAEPNQALPEAAITSLGELVVAGHTYNTNPARFEVLRDLRRDGDAIQVHVRPDMPLAQLRAFLDDANKAGVKRVALVAREPIYPWRKKAYFVATNTGMKANLRPTDAVQLLIHAVDELAGPGTIARVD